MGTRRRERGSTTFPSQTDGCLHHPLASKSLFRVGLKKKEKTKTMRCWIYVSSSTRNRFASYTTAVTHEQQSLRQSVPATGVMVVMVVAIFSQHFCRNTYHWIPLTPHTQLCHPFVARCAGPWIVESLGGDIVQMVTIYVKLFTGTLRKRDLWIPRTPQNQLWRM